MYIYEPIFKIERQNFCQNVPSTIRSIENFGFNDELKVISFVKLLIFGEMLMNGQIDHFPTNLEAKDYLAKNPNLDFSYINEKLQKYYLRNKRIFFKKIKTLIIDNRELEILNSFSKELDDVFTTLALVNYSSIKNLNPEEKLELIKNGGFKQIRILGTNHILMKIQLNNLRKELALLREEKGLLNEKYKILLLCGNHKNNKLFNEDQMKECDHMYELTKLIMPEEVKDDHIIFSKN